MPASPLAELNAAALREWVLAQAASPPTAHHPLLLGVSGGLDSMTLWRLVYDAGLPHAVSHINYGLRGRESEAETELVRETAAERKVILHLHRPAFSPGVGIQQRARAIRRATWEVLLPHHCALLLAHHAGDQVETMLQRLARGTGPQGLAGMLPVADRYWRPLLGFTRQELSAFAKTHGVRYAEDSSNQRGNYLRNRLRHEVIAPLLLAEPRTFAGFSLSAKRQADLLEFARAQVQDVLEGARLDPGPNSTEKLTDDFDVAGRVVPEVDGPYDRARLARVVGLEAFVGLWLGASAFASDVLARIASAIADDQVHRRRFLSKSGNTVCIVAGRRVWTCAIPTSRLGPVA